MFSLDYYDSLLLRKYCVINCKFEIVKLAKYRSYEFIIGVLDDVIGMYEIIRNNLNVTYD